jgi:predicted ATPase
LEQSANLDAAAHLNKGLDLLVQLPETEWRSRLELEMRLALGVSLTATDGAGANAVERTYLRAQELCAKLDERELLFPALWGLWRVQQARARMPAAHRLSRRLGDLATERQDRLLDLEARHAAWTTALLSGEPGVTLQQTAAGLELYRTENPDGHALIYGGHDTGVCAGILGAWAHWLVGKPDTAARMAREAMSQARGLKHPASLVHALHWGMPLYQFLGDAPALIATAREIGALAEQPGLVSPQYRDRARMLLGWGLSRMGKEQEGLDLFRSGLNARPKDDRHMRPYFLAVLAEMLLRREAHGDASDLVAQGLEILGETGECWWEPELRRLSGEAAGADAPELAREQMELALKQARAQRAKSLELRAANSVMRLSISLGEDAAEPWERLRQVYEGFAEGFGTEDLVQARSLLDSVSQGQSPS